MKAQIQRNKGGGRKLSTSSLSNSRKSDRTSVLEIAIKMRKEKLSDSFIVNAMLTSLDFEGVADLMRLWVDEENQGEKDEIIADIQDMIDACYQKEIVEEYYVRFNDLETIAKNIRVFKDNLLFEVEKNGGIKRLTELTGIPQPSLSRFFNSSSMPQRSTLLKISKALNLDALKMDSFGTGF